MHMTKTTDLIKGQAESNEGTPWWQAQAARDRVQSLARQIAADAPDRQGQYVHRAGIRWSLIHELREALATLDSITGGDS